ncbi:hypothetical protein AB0K52_23050 [Glycomyces sp. NPDC049804]|uniref:hypothetical protein n=1 Tax=Glycomyces sp. NPDC049804 TaxID=3154363 RepID=UPI003448DD3B
MDPAPQGSRPPEPAAPAPAAPSADPEAPQAEATAKLPAPPVFTGENDATVKVVPGAASHPPAAPAPSAFEKDDDFLTEAQAPAVAPGAVPPAPVSSTGAMPQTTLPSPVAPPAPAYAMTPPPMGSPGGAPPAPPAMPTGPVPLPPAPRKPRNQGAITFAVIAIVLFIAAAAFGILYSEKANDFSDQADRLAAVEAERDELEAAKTELEDEIVALQLERDNLQADSEARQVCSDALDVLIADEYPGTVDSLEDFASAEYLTWAEAHDELYREVQRQCLV